MVELQPSKLTTWVRFPSPAPNLIIPLNKDILPDIFFCCLNKKSLIKGFLAHIAGPKAVGTLLKAWAYSNKTLEYNHRQSILENRHIPESPLPQPALSCPFPESCSQDA